MPIARHIHLCALLLCGAGHEVMAQSCTGLCLQQVTCPGGGTTSVSGVVYAPNGSQPLPNVLVYVPNGGTAPDYGVQAFPVGVQPSAPVSGAPLVWTNSAVNGQFTLSNMPVGANIPLVIQAGAWRRKITVPAVAACTDTLVGASLTHLPRSQQENDPADNIPRIALVTGVSDALECTLRRIGIADSEFSDPPLQGGNGRVNLYLGQVGAGAQYSASTPAETQLFATQPALDSYDIAMLPCQSLEDTPTAAQDAVLVNFANAGGRVFLTHAEYTWLSNYVPFSGTAVWMVNQTFPTPDPQTAYIDTGFPAGLQLAQWLLNIGASTTLGQMSLQSLRHDLNGVTAPTVSWLKINSPPQTTMQLTFDTPIGQPPAYQTGRVLFYDFHVAEPSTAGQTFPAECSPAVMTPQEKLLEFDLFAVAASNAVFDRIFADGFGQ